METKVDRNERQEKVLKALQAAGYYQKKTAGLNLAYKIYELLAMEPGWPMRANEILEEEENRLGALDRATAIRLASLGNLADDDGKMKLTARLALARLVEVGLIQAKGKTRSRVYWVA